MATHNLNTNYFQQFLDNKKEITLNLINGQSIRGLIKDIGKFCLIVEIHKRPLLIFKHSIMSIELPKIWKFENRK